MARHKQGTARTPASPAESGRGGGQRGHVLRLAGLGTRKPTAFDLVPDAETLSKMRDRLELSGLRKLRLSGRLSPASGRDWHLEAHLGATVVQPCAVTLAPVTTRIEEPVTRRYLERFQPPADGENEMPEDDDAEPLPDRVDLLSLAEEALALALPAFPRAEGVAPVDVTARPEGTAEIEDAERPNPFAALAALKRGGDD